MTMTLEQALENVKNVLSQFKGTLAEHQAIQKSLELIVNKLKGDDNE